MEMGLIYYYYIHERKPTIPLYFQPYFTLDVTLKLLFVPDPLCLHFTLPSDFFLTSQKIYIDFLGRWSLFCALFCVDG